jgi:hypothetical protein
VCMRPNRHFAMFVSDHARAALLSVNAISFVSIRLLCQPHDLLARQDCRSSSPEMNCPAQKTRAVLMAKPRSRAALCGSGRGSSLIEPTRMGQQAEQSESSAKSGHLAKRPRHGFALGERKMTAEAKRIRPIIKEHCYNSEQECRF